MSRPIPTETRVCVARIGAAHGIRGEVRLHAFTEDPMAVARYGALEAEDRSRTFAIEALRPANGFLVARLAGIGDRNAAERLKNVSLFVPRDRLPVLDEADDYYHADLIGLAVVHRDGRTLGTVAGLHNFGAGDLIEVEPIGGPAVLLPFTKAVVPVVDVEGRRLVVDPPDGLFAGDLAEAAAPAPDTSSRSG
jgi:16S rRNA processing protein RimM